VVGRGSSVEVTAGWSEAARVFSATAATASETPRGTGGVRAPRPDRDTGALTAAATITFTRHRREPTVDLGASRRHRRRRPVPVVGRDGFWRALVPASRSRSGRTPGHAATSGPGTWATTRPEGAIHDRGRPPNGHTSDGRRASREE